MTTNGTADGFSEHRENEGSESDWDQYPSVHIGPRLRKLCDDHDPPLKQVDLARLLAPMNNGKPLDPAVPSTWLGGNRYRPVPGKYLPALAQILETSVTALLPADVGAALHRDTYVEQQSGQPDNEGLRAERALYVAEISGHTIGGWVSDQGPRPVPGRPPRELDGHWRLICRGCGYCYLMRVGQRAERTCQNCGAALAASVSVTVHPSSEQL